MFTSGSFTSGSRSRSRGGHMGGCEMTLFVYRPSDNASNAMTATPRATNCPGLGGANASDNTDETVNQDNHQQQYAGFVTNDPTTIGLQVTLR
jgi:hypothetical protein